MERDPYHDFLRHAMAAMPAGHPAGIRRPGVQGTDGTGGPQGTGTPSILDILRAMAHTTQHRMQPVPAPANLEAALHGLFGGGA